MKICREECRYGSIHLDPDTRWSGQLHAPATLTSGKNPLVRIGLEAGCAIESRRREKSCTAGNRTRDVEFVTRRHRWNQHLADLS
jgi:hypothetical protein